MIKVNDIETATRIIESANALSVILPLYDEEARRVFRATFKIDIADLMPEFFRQVALIALKRPQEFNAYMTYFEELISYIKKNRKTIPKPLDADDAYFTDARHRAKKLLNTWMIKQG